MKLTRHLSLAGFFLTLLFLSSASLAAANRKITIESARSVESEKTTDELTGDEKTVVVLRGNVIIVIEEDGDASRISADEVIYDRAREMMEARGNVRYENSASGSSKETFSGEAMLFNVTKQQGVFLDGTFARESDDKDADAVKIDTEVAARDSGTTIAFKRGTLTTCDDEEPHWHIKASRIWMLPGGELGLLNGVLYVGPLPIFYIPFFYFPGDEMVFHPVFGYRNRQGYFVQTTTYIYGRKPLADTSSNSFSGFTGGSDTLKKQVREGLFLRNTAEDDDSKSTDYLKIKLDAYSGLGVLAGVDGSFKPKNEWVDSLSFYTDVGFSRTLFLRSSSSSSYTPFDTDGTTNRDSGWFWGVELPFRYRGNFSYSMSKKPFSLSVTMPFISDPYFKQDFTDRSEDLNWIEFITNQSDLAQGDDSITTETSYTWSIYGSVTPDVSFLNPWITTLSISSVSNYVSFASKTNGSLSGNAATYSPERRFFYPEYIKPSITFKAAGTLLASETKFSSKGSSKKEDAPDLSRLKNPFEPEKKKASDEEEGEGDSEGEEVEQEETTEPGVAQRLEDAGYEFETTLEELLETREEDEGDEEYSIIDLSRLRAAGEEMTAEELAMLQAAGEEMTARELGVIGSAGVSLTDEEIEEIEAEVEEAFSSIETSVEVSTAPSATAKPVDRLIPSFSSKKSVASRALSSGAGDISYSLDWEFTPSFAFEGTFNTSAWDSPSDVSIEDFSSLFYQIKTPLSLQGEFSYDNDFIKISSDLNFTNTIQDHFYLSESVYPTGGSSRENVLLTDLTNSVFALELDNEVSIRPFKNHKLFSPVELTWEFTADLVHQEFTGTDSSNPEWTVSAIKWDEDYVDTHSLTAVVGVDAFGHEETLSFTTDLSPLLQAYEGELDLSWFFGSFNMNGKYFQEESADGGTEWEWDPVELSLELELPLDITFTTAYEHDFNENEPSTLSFKLSHDRFSAYYTMNNAIQYTLEEGTGWVAKGTEPEFKPYSLGASFSNTSKPFEFKFWKNRIAISIGIDTSLEFNLVKQTESSFSFSPEIKIEILDMFDLTFSSTSKNSVLARYFQKWMGLDVEIPGETNIFIDLAKSFNFWSTSDRQSSGFKLSTLEMEMNHYLHDWTATLKASVSPELVTGSDGRYTYEFIPEISFIVSWKPAPALGATAKTEDGSFTLSASGSSDD